MDVQKQYTVLVCDDEEDIVEAMRVYLESDGYRVLSACNGQQALALFQKETVHLVMMDVMMPGLSGLETMQKMFAVNSRVPVILVTARSRDTDEIAGLRTGADDYITKPFNPVLMLAKARAAIRRAWERTAKPVAPETTLLRNGDVTLDSKRKEAKINDRPIHLTPTEFDILQLFMEHVGEVFSLAEIYRRVKHEEPYGSEGTIAVHIRHLREKIEIDPANPVYIQVKFGQGYKMEKR